MFFSYSCTCSSSYFCFCSCSYSSYYSFVFFVLMLVLVLVFFLFLFFLFVFSLKILIANHPHLPTRSNYNKYVSTKRGILKSCRIPLFLLILVIQNKRILKKDFFNYLIIFSWISILLVILMLKSYLSSSLYVSRYFISIFPAIILVISIALVSIKNIQVRLSFLALLVFFMAVYPANQFIYFQF